MQYRIGDRDPVTGLYDVIWPDGSFARNGIKIFNSAHEFGDVVLATHRSDGMIILDGVKAHTTETTTNFSLGGFDEKPVGYLKGQVFNNEDEVILSTVSIEFAPGSPTDLEPNTGDFVVRIKIDRPQNKDLRVRCELVGTASNGDYTVTGLDNDRVAIIPAGQLFFDLTATPTQNSAGQNESIEINLLQSRDYWIGQDRTVTATILTTIALDYLSKGVGLFGGSATAQDITFGYSPIDGAKNAIVMFSLADSNSVAVVAQSDLTVNFRLTFAFVGVDFSLSSNVSYTSSGSITDCAVTIPSGSSSVTVEIIRIQDYGMLVDIITGGYIIANTTSSTIIREKTLSISADIEYYPPSYEQINPSGPSNPPTRSLVQNGESNGFDFIIRSNQPVRGNTDVNLSIMGVLIADYLILENLNQFQSTPGKITIFNNTSTARVALVHKDRPRMIPPSESLTIQIVSGAYLIGAINSAIATTTRRLRRTFQVQETNPNPLTTCDALIPLEYTVSSSVFGVRKQYNYYEPTLSFGILTRFTFTADEFNNGTFNMSAISAVIGQPGIIPGETVAARRARMLVQPKIYPTSGAIYETVTTIWYTRECNYIELGNA